MSSPSNTTPTPTSDGVSNDSATATGTDATFYLLERMVAGTAFAVDRHGQLVGVPVYADRYTEVKGTLSSTGQFTYKCPDPDCSRFHTEEAPAESVQEPRVTDVTHRDEPEQAAPIVPADEDTTAKQGGENAQ